MARLIFECRDAQGNLVKFVSSEKEGKELMANYAGYVKWLADNDFALLQAKGGKSGNSVNFFL